MKSKVTLAAVALAGFAIAFAAAVAGTYYGNQLSKSNVDFEHDIPVMLKADAASAGKSLSMATGLVDRDEGVEGLFVLDHLSGTLQCWVINPRNGTIAGMYGANVNKDLELGKGGDNDYVMVCGQFNANNAQIRRGNNLPAGCVCYVGDGNTGKVVGYSFFYDRQTIIRNGTQKAALEVVARGIARESSMTRDN